MKRHVIVGNSGAAISAVKAIRSINKKDEITLISRENCPAYSPVLTTYYLSGVIPYEGMFFCDEGFYRRNRVETVLGKKAMRINPSSKCVYLEDGTSVQYDDLLVATGSSTWVPSLPGVSLPGVFTLWTAEDARRLWDSARNAEAIAIVGGGLIGTQVMSAMLRRGKKATLVEIMGHIMPMALDSGGASIIEQRLVREGVQLFFNETVVEIRDGRKKGLLLASGKQIETDVVVMATGVRPNVALLEGSGVKVSQGVLVDEYSRTNVADIYAAGDVAEGVGTVTGKPALNATWPNAIEQGHVAGLNMAGMNIPRLRNVRSNISAILDIPFASVGLVQDENGLEEGAACYSAESYARLFFNGDILVGAVLVGEIDSIGILANLVGRHQPLTTAENEELRRSGAFAYFARAFLR